VPIDTLRVIVGALLLVFGLQWLRKAILRAGGYKPPNDEEAAYTEQRDQARGAARDVRAGVDGYSFTVAFKGVFLKGLEVAFSSSPPARCARTVSRWQPPSSPRRCPRSSPAARSRRSSRCATVTARWPQREHDRGHRVRALLVRVHRRRRLARGRGGRRGDRADPWRLRPRGVGVVVGARRGGRAVRVAVASHRTASMTARVM
jgi:hypothetical protein